MPSDIRLNWLIAVALAGFTGVAVAFWEQGSRRMAFRRSLATEFLARIEPYGRGIRAADAGVALFVAGVRIDRLGDCQFGLGDLHAVVALLVRSSNSAESRKTR